MSEAPVLQASDIRVRYGRGLRRTEILAGIDLVVRRGEIVGLRGPSGCGKSTLLRVLSTLERPSSGELKLGGDAVRRPRRDGYIMPIGQNPSSSLDPRWPIWKSITEPLTAVHLEVRPSKAQRRAIAEDELASIGLQGMDVEATPRQLSGGQCQRVTILRALIAKPRLLIADEPTSALDVSIAAGVLNLLSSAAEAGAALVMASHDRNSLEVLCDRVYEVREGRLHLLTSTPRVGRTCPAVMRQRRRPS